MQPRKSYAQSLIIIIELKKISWIHHSLPKKIKISTNSVVFYSRCCASTWLSHGPHLSLMSLMCLMSIMCLVSLMCLMSLMCLVSLMCLMEARNYFYYSDLCTVCSLTVLCCYIGNGRFLKHDGPHTGMPPNGGSGSRTRMHSDALNDECSQSLILCFLTNTAILTNNLYNHV